jgi:hypothetical protein
MITYMGLLDNMLKRIATSAEMEFTHHSFHDITKDYTVRVALLNYLFKKELVVVTTDDITPRYAISVEGAMFYQNGGFIAEYRRLRRNDLLETMKLVATVAYSLAVLAVAIWAVWVEMGR